MPQPSACVPDDVSADRGTDVSASESRSRAEKLV